MFHQLGTDYADTLIAAKRFADAHAELDAIFALEQANQSSTLPATQTTRAELALAETAWAEAAHFAELAIAAYEAAGGKDNPQLWRPLTALARAQLGAGKRAAAKPFIDRAVAIGKAAQVSDEDLATTQAVAAQLATP
jgi:hypothetical protein